MRIQIRSGIPVARLRGRVSPPAQAVLSGLVSVYRRLTPRRGMWLFAAELAGVALAISGIAMWSLPIALVAAGLAIAVAAEIQPPGPTRFPAIPPPESNLRAQAESAAIVINNARFGLAVADTDALAKLTPAECEQVITAARNLGASRT